MKTPKSVEQNLQKLLDNYGLTKKLTVQTVKDWVFNDEGDSAVDASNRFHKEWLKYFRDEVKDLDELNNLMQIFVDAWNYFPHQPLDGKSPFEKIQEAPKEKSTDGGGEREMPGVIVGGHKMSWDDYWTMIKEMERLQVPFKTWIEEEILPKYEKFLKNHLKPKTQEKYLDVAHVFFRRILHVGFIEFDQIREGFVQREFPHWWQTHVMFRDLSEKEIVSSLRKFFQFISSEFGKDITKFFPAGWRVKISRA